MRNPNGYGTVTKLSGNRRKPFTIRKTKGWDNEGKRIVSYLGYYETKEEALMVLAEYNRNPYDIDAAKITLEELFKMWLEFKLPKLGKSNQGSLRSAFKHCLKFKNMKYKELKAFHMQDCIDNCGCGYSTQASIRNLFKHLDKFAYELDVINKQYSILLTSEPIPETSKKPFTDEEVNEVWEIQDQEWVDSVLFLLYSGFRISEMLSIESENVDLVARTIKGGVKTKAGKDRIVPIHSKIVQFVQRRKAQGNKYLFNCPYSENAPAYLIKYSENKPMSALRYYDLWYAIMEQLGFVHTPHECRHTFRSRLDSAGANKRCIDLMMGHKSKDVGERIYTHKTIEQLTEAIELLD